MFIKPVLHCCFSALIIVFILVCRPQPVQAADLSETQQEAKTRQWVEEWGDKWWERYHDDYDAQYPGGRSNRYHDLYIAESMKRLAETSTSNWKISNQQYMFDGEWFAVEWFYESTHNSTGKVQRESTIAFGKIEDDHLRVWVEYFDDMVGHYQYIGAMRLPAEEETPFPWPENTALTRKYRP